MTGMTIVSLSIKCFLCRYMQSFAKKTDAGEVLVIPTNVLDRWLERLKKKVQLDPGSLYRSDDG